MASSRSRFSVSQIIESLSLYSKACRVFVGPAILPGDPDSTAGGGAIHF